MDRIYDELEEVKAEAEKLKEECRAKTELSNSLRKAHIEQLAKIQQEKLEIDKLGVELNAKSNEIREIRQMYEELQSSLLQKDLFLQQISSANEKLGAEYNEKISKLEGENRDLVLALDEASSRIQDLETKTCASSEEIAGLKRLLLTNNPEKSFEVQKNASRILEERDEYILKLEEENRVTKDRLKWKNEQFSHLEEAHGKLQTQYEESKVDWQKEKFTLINEISSLQAALDAQVRVSEKLEVQLRMSNQALAHEESRRKVLEIEVSESRSQFENVFRDSQLAKSEIEQLTMKRDEEIAELRILLRKIEMVATETNYRAAQLEQENSELLVSLKDIQEAQINKPATTSTLKKLRNKLQGLEQAHNKCAINLKEKEAEWNAQIEKLRGDMNNCLSELDGKDRSIRELHKKLEDCQFLLEVKKEEISSLIMVLTSEFSVAYSNLYDAKEKNMLLNQQLLSKDSELYKVQTELKQRCEEIAVLMERVESLDSLNQKDNLKEEELRRYKAMLDESNECQRRLKQQFLELENSQGENIRNALEMVNFELTNRKSEVEKLKLELQKLKSEAENLKLNSGENQQAHKQEKSSLLVIVKDKDAAIGKLQEQICVLEYVVLAKSETAEMLNQEKNEFIRLAEDRNSSIKSLQNEIAQLKNELVEREAGNTALLDANKILEQENERFSSNIKEKDQRVHQLQKEFESLDLDFKSAMTSLTEKEVMLDEALKTAGAQKKLEIDEKNQKIANLEKEVESLHKEIEGKSLVQSKQVALQLEVSLQEMKSEMQELRCQLYRERRCFEDVESHKLALLEDLSKATLDRENLLAQLDGLYGKIGIFCRDDVELAGMLGEILHLSEEDSEPERDLLSDGFNDIDTFSPLTKSIQGMFDERTPLAELNC